MLHDMTVVGGERCMGLALVDAVSCAPRGGVVGRQKPNADAQPIRRRSLAAVTGVALMSFENEIRMVP